MTDTTSSPGQAIELARPQREIRVVESSTPIMDTARFEHLFRVATVMADAGLMPESLMTYKGKDEGGREVVLWHTPATIRARAFLIANQADLWKADPMAVAQCTSLVHGKLMYEGKLVHGILSERLGVDLSYEFGQYDFKARDIVVGQMPEIGDQSFGVRVSGTIPGEAEPRWIAVCVSMLHTGTKGPWEKQTAWPRQLRYGGAREWCRAHKPSLLLGIMTDDEIDMIEAIAQERRAPKNARTKPDLGGKLAAPQASAALEGPAGPTAGFSREHVAQETDEGRPAPIQTEEETPHDPVTGELIEDQVTAQETEIEEEEEGELTLSPEDEVVLQGHAGPGVQYLLAGEEFGEDGRTPSYMDGLPFSRVGEKGAAKLDIFSEHAPKPAAAAAASEEEKVGIRDNPEDRKDPAQAESQPAADLSTETEEVNQPTFMDEISAMTSWLSVKPRFAALNKEEGWKSLTPEEQDLVRANIWRVVEQIKKDHRDPVDFATDPSAFRLWMETQAGKDGANAIEGSFRVLLREPAFTRMPQPMQDGMSKTVEAKIKSLRGKK